MYIQVHTFYAYWQSFSTVRSFVWEDVHDLRQVDTCEYTYRVDLGRIEEREGRAQSETVEGGIREQYLIEKQNYKVLACSNYIRVCLH